MTKRRKRSADERWAVTSVLVADLGGAVILAKIVHIPNSYLSLGLLVAVWVLSLWVVAEYWAE